MNPHHKKWPREHMEALINGAKLGRTAKEVAEKIGRSRSAVLGMALRHKIKFGRHDKKSTLKDKKIYVKKGCIKKQVFFEQPTALVIPIKPHVNRRGVSMLDITNGMCRFPIGEPRAKDFCLCGQPSIGVYCSMHSRMVRNVNN